MFVCGNVGLAVRRGPWAAWEYGGNAVLQVMRLGGPATIFGRSRRSGSAHTEVRHAGGVVPTKVIHHPRREDPTDLVSVVNEVCGWPAPPDA